MLFLLGMLFLLMKCYSWMEMWALRLCLSPNYQRQLEITYNFPGVGKTLLHKERKKTLEINDWFSYGEIALYSPWQVKDFGCDEFEDLVYINVVGCTGKKQCCIEGLRI
ncbi:LOW QUALITY PROTEIN: hypothetical protein TorRG33x02_204080 [Trema orientale]|uniref:Uncharacterized protein n=1 Tax=Trema orientale TaxID=63057 RepID=A0A2P5EE90_TREOI|nr:LOW QUALITY PROTEIN: hypothetical protein TorRG33x02_204080 [Trema orientale]